MVANSHNERWHIMNEITNLNDYVVTGVFSIDGSMKPDKEASKDEIKRFTLRIHCNQTPLKSIATKAFDSTKIAWVNGVGRAKIDTIKDRSVIDIDFSSPAKQVETREEQIEKLSMQFQKAGLPKTQALELATKAVDNPEVLKD